MIELIQNGGVTSPKGFIAGGTFAGLKTREQDTLDLGILLSDRQSSIAGTFTSNKVVSPSVTLSRDRSRQGIGRGVIANSGCANCCVGGQGLDDAKEMTALAARHVDCSEDDILVCSTGMIGVELPMALIRQHVSNIKLSKDGGSSFAKAIMTTDTRPKEVAVSIDIDGTKITIGGAAKGVGMIHPNMATMLGFLTTDASIDPDVLQQMLSKSVDVSFNMIDVDGDQSTNDSVLLIANGASESTLIELDSGDANEFNDALTYVCTELAKELVRDGEGAQRLIEVMVEGAKDEEDARKAARSVSSSNLVKAMVHGRDPNWGRIMMAIGKSSVMLEESRIDIYINDIHIVHEGVSIPFFKDAVISAMSAPEVKFRMNLNLGECSATAWSCDLTEEYVTFNSAYST